MTTTTTTTTTTTPTPALEDRTHADACAAVGYLTGVAVIARHGRVDVPGRIGAVCLRGPDARGNYMVMVWATVAPNRAGFVWLPLVWRWRAEERVERWRVLREGTGKASTIARKLPRASVSLEDARAMLHVIRAHRGWIRWRPSSGGYAGYGQGEEWRLPPETPAEVRAIVAELPESPS